MIAFDTEGGGAYRAPAGGVWLTRRVAYVTDNKTADLASADYLTADCDWATQERSRSHHVLYAV